ncbi:MAG: hypothetical protein JSU71_15630, partial [Betaproteobacteria bacterium]
PGYIGVLRRDKGKGGSDYLVGRILSLFPFFCLNISAFIRVYPRLMLVVDISDSAPIKPP